VRPLFQLVLVLRDERISLQLASGEITRTLESACQMTGCDRFTPRQDGQCVVLVHPREQPWRRPRSPVRQFAWFFNEQALPFTNGRAPEFAERCGRQHFSLKASLLASGRSWYADGYVTTPVSAWAHLATMQLTTSSSAPARTQPRLNRTQWQNRFLEELECVLAIRCRLACANPALPYRWEVFQFILFDRLFREPTAVDGPQNSDACGPACCWEKTVDSMRQGPR